MRGRPFAFLGLVVAGWVGTRAALLWSTGEVATLGEALRVAVLPPAPADDPPPPPAAAAGIAPPARAASPGLAPAASLGFSDARILALFGVHHFVAVQPRAADGPAAAVAPLAQGPVEPGVGAALAAAPVRRAPPARWTASGWASVRAGGGDPDRVPLLGGSQAGVRIGYALDGARRIALFGRVAAPLATRGTEAAGGAQWRPTAAPVVAFAEVRHRAALGTAPALGLFGGGALALPRDFRLDGYGQAGWVGGRAATGFAEGQVQVARPVAAMGAARVELGAGIWGAAQRGARRLDVGPGIALVAPAGAAALRLGVDWRLRVAGRAAPASGPALTLAAGF